MMACPVEIELERFVHGLCPAAEADRISGHARQCLRCESWISDARGDDELLESILGRRRRAGPGAGLLDGPLAGAIAGCDILREISRGGQGVVYEAAQRSTGRRVAIKVLRDGAFSSQRDRRRFRREVELLAGLRHPNVVVVHASGEVAGCVFSIMDFVEGRPLDVAAPREARAVVELFVRICEGVAAAHVRGIMHRDLKPSNILVDDAGEPRIMDFGLARVSGGAETVTEAGQFVGSLPWASPEQVAGGPDAVDIRADVYALGVMLYEALTGRPPYATRGSLAQTVHNIRTAVPAPPSRLRRGVRSDLDAIALRCLAKEPAERYDSAGALGRDLRALLDDRPVDARAASRWYLLRKTLRRHRAAVALLCAAVFALGAFATSMTVMYRRSVQSEIQAKKERESLMAELRIYDLHNTFIATTEPSVASGGAGAIAALDAAVTRARAELRNTPESLLLTFMDLADEYDLHGAGPMARALRREAAAQLDPLGDAPRVIMRAGAIADRIIDGGDPAFAEDLLRRYAPPASPDPQPSPVACDLYTSMARAALAQGELRRAREYSDLTMRLLGRMRLPAYKPEVRALTTRAQLLERLGEPDAQQPLRAAIEVMRRPATDVSGGLPVALRELGELLLRSDRPGEAIEPLAEALALFKAGYGPESAEANATAELLSRAIAARQ